MKILLSTIILAAMAAGASAQTAFHAAADFSDSANANGAWSYGRKASSLSDPFALNGTYYASNLAGGGWNDGNGFFPVVGQLTGDTYGGTAGQLYLYGDNAPGATLAVVRWTAPQAATLSISGAFFAGQGQESGRYVARNGGAIFSATASTTDSPFSLSTIVAAGDTIDFAVGPGSDGSNGGLVPFDATIVATPVPEPASLAGLALGGLALLRRRRK